MAKRNSQGAILFGLPVTHPVNLIIITNVIVFILQILADRQMLYFFGLIPDRVMDGNYWTLFTYGFLHSTAGLIPLHLLLNMYVLFFLWLFMEPETGKMPLAIIYFGGILGGGLLVQAYSLIISYFYGNNLPMVTPTIGASGGIFALLTLFGILYPERELFIFFFIIKARNAVIASLFFSIILSYLFEVPVSNAAHLGGALTGLLLYVILFRKKGEKKTSKRVDPKPELVDHLDKQTAENDELLAILSSVESKEKKIAILNTRKVANANICPIDTYNPDDPFCRRCEWLPNCELRKLEKK